MTDTTRPGFVAIVGRPNVGKSTLLNALIGEKGAGAVRSTANDRHELLGLLAICAALLVVCIILILVRYLLSPLRHASPAIGPLRDLMFLVIIACEVLLAFRAV